MLQRWDQRLSRLRMNRRDLLLGSFVMGSVTSLEGQSSPSDEGGYRPLFDGATLRGWSLRAGNPGEGSFGNWFVDHGAIGVNFKAHSRGAYLVSAEAFDDFDLAIDVWPDWPVATGILIRTVPEGNVGIQVPLNYRPHGRIAGYYGRGLGEFQACQYAFSASTSRSGHVEGLRPELPSAPPQRIPLDFAAPVDVFLRIWKTGDWNRFRIRSVGELPSLTTWINGEKISELDTRKVKLPEFDVKAILGRIGRTGHIALEVHGYDAQGGRDRGAPACRWRNIYIRTL